MSFEWIGQMTGRVLVGSAFAAGLMLAAGCTNPPSPNLTSASPASTSGGQVDSYTFPSTSEALPEPVVAAVDVDRGLSEIRVTVVVENYWGEEGECSIEVLGQAGKAAVAQQPILNVDRTECGGMVVPLADVGEGEATVHVSFSWDDNSVVGTPHRMVIE